ncbi:MAG: branched-chain-amino-acid transaminase [Planctomycetes bacterium]|nr:branched-chain-amino-acid transaminase [Planctomycetota bacterium]
MGTIIYLNGEFVSKEDAKVSLFDHGYLFGDGIFETLRSYNGIVFKFDEHLHRLFNSAKYLMLSISISKAALKSLVYDALKRSLLQDAYVRITLSRGVGERGINPESCKKSTLSIIVKEIPLYPEECFSSGIEAMIVSIRKMSNESLSPQVKSCNYQNNILAKIELNQHGLLEGFLLNEEGRVTEGTVSNVFIMKRGDIMTPSHACGCLEGVTRNTVIEIAKNQLQLCVHEAEFTRYDLYTADECFITNTIMEIMPVVKVDGRVIGNGKPGQTTQKLQSLYQELTFLRRSYDE